MQRMTLRAYQDAVARLCRLQEPEAIDITAWVNECLRELQPYARLEASAVLQPDAGRLDVFTPPADMYRPTYLALDGRDEIGLLPDWDRENPGARLFAGKLVVQPPPASRVTLYLEYERLLRPLVNLDDVPDLDPEWHDLPLLYACMRAKQQDDEFAEAAQFAQQYELRKLAFRGARQRRKGVARRVRVVRPWL